MRNCKRWYSQRHYAVAFAISLGLLIVRTCLAGLPPPVILVQPVGISVPLLGTASFSVTAASDTTMSYQWYLNGAQIQGATQSSYTILSASASSAGTYTVKVSNSGGSVTSTGAILTILYPPGVTTQPLSQSVPLGQNATFSVVASGTVPLSYQWRYKGTAIIGATSSALRLSAIQTNQAGGYDVVVANLWGSVTSAVATLTVIIPPAITNQPQNQLVAQGAPVTFSVGASGTAPLSYQWYYNGYTVNGSGGTGPTLTINNPNPNKAGNYFVTVANAAGSVTSAVATLTVLVPPGIAVQPTNQSVVVGQNVSFYIAANGSMPLSYQWTLNGSPVAGATNTSLALTNVQIIQAGNYAAIVTNLIGSITSHVAALTVGVPASIAAQPQDQLASRSQTVTFSVVPNGTSPFQFAWYFNGSPVGQNSASLTITNVLPQNAGAYQVIVQNTWGSATSAVAALTVTNPPLVLSVPPGSGLTATGFTFQVSAGAGVTYVVESSAECQTWTPLATNVALAALDTFTDADATNHPTRLYRARLP